MRGDWRTRDDEKFARRTSRNSTDGPGSQDPSDLPSVSEEEMGIPKIEPPKPKPPRIRTPVHKERQALMDLYRFNNRSDKVYSTLNKGVDALTALKSFVQKSGRM